MGGEETKKAEQQGEKEDFKRAQLENVKLPVAHLMKRPQKK